MQPTFAFDDLFVLDLANNHQGDVEHGRRVEELPVDDPNHVGQPVDQPQDVALRDGRQQHHLGMGVA